MCKNFIYARVSTLEQNYDQQMQDIRSYFASHNLNMDEVAEIVSEHESGGKSYADRKFQQLLNKCSEGDYIYAASTDRLGRNFIDMMRLMEDAKKRGVIIVACKQNLSLDDNNSMAKIVLAVTAIMDEDERKRIKHRTANKKASQREQIEKNGHFIIENGPNAGLPCSYVGTPKWEKMTDAQRNRVESMREASILAKQDALIEWRETSAAYQWAIAQIKKGKTRKLVVAEFNELHEQQPNVYCTRQGKPLTLPILSKWIALSNPIAI